MEDDRFVRRTNARTVFRKVGVLHTYFSRTATPLVTNNCFCGSGDAVGAKGGVGDGNSKVYAKVCRCANMYVFVN